MKKQILLGIAIGYALSKVSVTLGDTPESDARVKVKYEIFIIRNEAPDFPPDQEVAS